MRAQVSLEFIIFTTMGVFITITLTAVAIHLVSIGLQEEAAAEAESLASSIQQELILADEMREGYHRELQLPTRLQRQEYHISNTNKTITINQERLTITLNTPTTKGTLQKGRNLITKENGTVTITH